MTHTCAKYWVRRWITLSEVEVVCQILHPSLLFLLFSIQCVVRRAPQLKTSTALFGFALTVNNRAAGRDHSLGACVFVIYMLVTRMTNCTFLFLFFLETTGRTKGERLCYRLFVHLPPQALPIHH